MFKFSAQRIAVLQQEGKTDDEKASSINSSTTETVQLLNRIQELESELEAKKEEVSTILVKICLLAVYK